jgi:hypothetical protein
MQILEKSCKEPERKQLKQGSDDRRMNEAVGQGLPQRAVQKIGGNEAEAQNQRDRCGGYQVLANKEREECADIDENDLPSESAKPREGKRTGSESWHRKQQGTWWSVRVSWSQARVAVTRGLFHFAAPKHLGGLSV